MYPSFILTMFEKRINTYIKVCGIYKGLSITQYDNYIEVMYNGVVDNEYVGEVTGLWFDPDKYVNDVSSKFRDKVEELVKLVKFIRIATSRPDYLIILISTFLSRNTDYYTNVIRWVQKICRESGSVANLNPEDVRRVGSSYQLQQLAEVLEQLKSVKLEEDFWKIRKCVLSIKYAGPKVADAFLIFSKITTCLAPTDIHYVRFVKRVGFFSDIDIVYPQKNYCLRYTCENCPRATRCLTGLSYRNFGRLSAWIQTVSYVIDREFCSRGKCLECPLSSRVCDTGSHRAHT